MSDLIDWYRTREREGEHPIILAATFHYRFVRIHPFDDGNGRMGRLLMNMILIKHGYTVALVRRESRDEFIHLLEQADKTEELGDFINFIARCCEYALSLYIRAAGGEPIDDVDDIDKEIALFKRSLANPTEQILFVREYYGCTLYPFYEYCAGKTREFSEMFGSVRTSGSFIVTTNEGEVVPVQGNPAGLPASLDDSAMWDHLSSISFRVQTSLEMFQGRDEHVFLEVVNSTDSHRSIWTFSVVIENVQWEHEGRDLEDLKKQFNVLLRRMMEHLKQVQD